MNQLNPKELTQLPLQELMQKLLEMRQEYFKLRLDSTASSVKSFPSQKRVLRKNIARLLTQLNKG